MVSLPERTRTIFSLVAEKLVAVWPALSCTRARLECGTRRASVLLMWLNLEMTFGTQPESKSSGPPWECRNSRKLLVAFAQGHEGMQRPTASLLEGMPGDAHQQAGSGHCFPAHVNGARNRSGPLGALPMLEKRLPPLEVTNNPGGANRWEAVWVSFSWPHACWIAGFCEPSRLVCLADRHFRSRGMVGSTSRLPLPNTTFGRPLYLPNHAPQTRLIYVPHSGAGTSDVWCGCPTQPEFRITHLVFRTIVCERLRLFSLADRVHL